MAIDNVGFVRLDVGDAVEETTIDLGTDARLRPTDRSTAGVVLSVEELGADKLLALFSRAQVRDFVDVAALAERLGGIERLCELAVEKDPGFSRAVLTDMLGSYARFTGDDFREARINRANWRPGSTGGETSSGDVVGRAQPVTEASTTSRPRVALTRRHRRT